MAMIVVRSDLSLLININFLWFIGCIVIKQAELKACGHGYKLMKFAFNIKLIPIYFCW